MGEPTSPIHTIDVAHPPRSADEVEGDLIAAWGRVRNDESLRILKVIHGYGSTGSGGATKSVVRGWLFRHRDRFRSVVEGEQYSLYNTEVQTMRKELGSFDDGDLSRNNPGITVVWVK